MKRSEVRTFLREGVETITPSLAFYEGQIPDFAAQPSNQYPSVLSLLEVVQPDLASNSAPSDSWDIKLYIFNRDTMDSNPDLYEGIVDSCDEVAQKLVYKYRNVIEGYKLVTMVSLRREKFIKSSKLGPDVLTGVVLSFVLKAPDKTNVC